MLNKKTSKLIVLVGRKALPILTAIPQLLHASGELIVVHDASDRAGGAKQIANQIKVFVQGHGLAQKIVLREVNYIVPLHRASDEIEHLTNELSAPPHLVDWASAVRHHQCLCTGNR